MIQMYDSIQSNIPSNAEAVAGYTGGHWPTFTTFQREFPQLDKAGRVLSIAVTASAWGRCLDIENGDAVPSQAPGWLKTKADRTHGLPVLYTSASEVSAVVGACQGAGIQRNEYLIWSAHYGFKHVCSPSGCGYPQADGTQFNDLALGRNLDESLLNDNFFAPAVIPDPNHYHWFSTGLEVLGPKRLPLHELDIVQQYDTLRRQPKRHVIRLRQLRGYLKLLADAVYEAHRISQSSTVIAERSWDFRNRGWRFQQLAKRANGEQVVK
jgi:hypothetical protein